jgi:hypothetical protein
VLVTKPLGLYMFKVFSGERTWVSPVLVPVERAIYRVSGVDDTKEQGWFGRAVSLLLFGLVGLMTTFVILRLQGDLPFNPEDLGAVKSDLAFGTSASFTTNTNWQAYSGETTMSYFSQMVGLAVTISPPPPSASMWPWLSCEVWRAAGQTLSAISGSTSRGASSTSFSRSPSSLRSSWSGRACRRP